MSTQIFTISEVADRLRVTPKTVRNWIKAGHLDAKRIGERGHWRITRTALRDFLERAGLNDADEIE